MTFERHPVSRSEATGGSLEPWAIQMAWRDAGAAVVLRLKENLAAARVGADFWIRGQQSSAELAKLIKQLPLQAWYRVLPDGQLVPMGKRLPVARLPEAEWWPLKNWFRQEIPPALLPGRAAGRVALRLERGGPMREPGAILLEPDAWRRFALTAANVRLKPLVFAVSADGRCLVRGRPVPPLEGVRLADVEGLLVPGGFSWEPAIDPALVRQVLDVSAEDVVLWNTDGTWERIDPSQFVNATRSAVRRSLETIA